jgi:hypothetical protein
MSVGRITGNRRAGVMMALNGDWKRREFIPAFTSDFSLKARKNGARSAGECVAFHARYVIVTADSAATDLSKVSD